MAPKKKMKAMLSWRHHYIPQFYLRNFTNADGFFYLFNKEKGIIEKNAKSPESYFFERDRNTFMMPHGELDDFIETSFYKKFDDLSKYAFQKLMSHGVTAVQDDARAFSSIIQFINGIFYRVPKYDGFHNGEIANGNVKYLLPIYKKDGHVDVSREYFENHKQEALYRYACRFFLSLHGIIPVGTELNKWSVFELPKDSPRQVFITGDCPLILNDEHLFNSGQEIILMPLTSKHVALRTSMPIRPDMNMTELIYFTNLSLMSNAERYVCSSDREILDFYKVRMANFEPGALKSKVLSLLEGDL